MAQDPQDDPFVTSQPVTTRFIRFETTQAVSRITLNRPPGNILSIEMMEEIASALVRRFQEGSAPVLQLARRAVTGGLDLLLPDAARHAEDVYLNQLLATEDVAEG